MEENSASILSGAEESGAAAAAAAAGAGATGSTEMDKEVLEAAVGEGAEKEKKGLSEEMKDKLEEAKQKTLNTLNVVHDTLEGLTDYQKQLHEWLDEQLVLENKLVEVLENAKRIRVWITEEQERVADMKDLAGLMKLEDDGEGRRV